MLPEWMIPFVVGQGQLVVDGVTHPYQVLSRELAPDLEGFLGFPEGQHLFISEDVPEQYRPFMLAHEVREFGVLAGQEGRCCQALQQELAEVPEDMCEGYIAYRRAFFVRLVAYYAQNDDPRLNELKAEIAGSLAHLEHLVA